MFLPVLLVRDYGLWGFVVFAVPNVIGAGAMGWVLREGASERIVREHGPACTAFSLVTMAFQAFFLGWLPALLVENAWDSSQERPYFVLYAMILSAAAVACVSTLAARRDRSAWTVAALLWIVSAAMAIAMLGPGTTGALGRSLGSQERPAEGLLWLAPVCLFGFALCPYLDLTFHRARRGLAAQSARLAFGLGFGVLFFAMILFTLIYSPLVRQALWDRGESVRHFALLPLLIHSVAQLSFTVGVHAVEAGRGRAGAIATLAVAVCAFAAPRLYPAAGSLGTGEVIYRLFMSFYGLVFPAYVWLCMIPTPDAHSGAAGPRGRLKLRVLAAAVALAAPFYWMGFIERREWWLAPGLGVVLLARLLVRSAPKPSPA
jgi:hypothetical protein